MEGEGQPYDRLSDLRSSPCCQEIKASRVVVSHTQKWFDRMPCRPGITCTDKSVVTYQCICDLIRNGIEEHLRRRGKKREGHTCGVGTPCCGGPVPLSDTLPPPRSATSLNCILSSQTRSSMATRQNSNPYSRPRCRAYALHTVQ